MTMILTGHGDDNAWRGAWRMPVRRGAWSRETPRKPTGTEVARSHRYLLSPDLPTRDQASFTNSVPHRSVPQITTVFKSVPLTSS